MRMTTLSITTTGYGETDEVLRITCACPVDVNKSEIVFDTLVRPEDHVDWDSSITNGITIDDVKNAPSRLAAIKKLNNFLKNFDTVICYNAEFVKSFLTGVSFDCTVVDLMATCSALNGEVIVKNGVESYKYVSFKYALNRFGLDINSADRYDLSIVSPLLISLYSKVNRYYPDTLIKSYLYSDSKSVG